MKSEKAPKKAAEENLTHTLVTIAPDGGWAWVILMVSTWDCLCIDGMSLGYSVIQDKVVKSLNISGVESSMFVSVFNCIVYLTGPVTAAVANRYGFKILNIVGGALGVVSLILCYWSRTFATTLILFSIFGGLGGAMIYMVSMACPGYWFEARRSLAFGLSNSASGIACLIVPPLSNVASDAFGWRSVFIMLALMFLAAFAFGFLIRKPPMVLVEIEGYRKSEDPAHSYATVSMSILNVRGGGARAVDEKMAQMTQQATPPTQPTPVFRGLSSPSLIYTQEPSKWRKLWYFLTCSKPDDVAIERPMYKSDIFLQNRGGNVKNMTQADYMLSMHKMTTEKDIRQQLEDRFVCCPEAIMRPLKDMLSISLLKNVVYVIFLIDTMIYYSAIYVTYLFIPRTAMRKGIPEAVSILLLQLFGSFMALTRISLGVIFHFFPNLPPQYFTGCYVVIGGCCHAALSLTTNVVASCVIGSVAGFFIGVWVPMRSVLVVRYIGLDKLTNAMGMLFVFQAIGSLFGAPLAEALVTACNEDYMAYYFAGAMYAISGAMILPLEYINNMLKKRALLEK